jgi:arginyl-tRNA synthetase
LDSVLDVRNKIIEALGKALEQTQKNGLLPQIVVPEIALERPQKTGYGDYASSLPLKLARACGLSPIVIAQHLAEAVVPFPELGAVTVAPPGFINFTFKNEWLSAQVGQILKTGVDYGNIDLGHGSTVQVEFVSANPTGPLHVGHGRGAVLGSTIANILEAAGYCVTREYYVNDAGSQMNAFYRTLWARYQQALGIDAAMPTDGYLGQYMVELAAQIVGEYGSAFNLPDEDKALAALGKVGIEYMLDLIREDLSALGVDYDCWFSEKSLFATGQYQRVLDLLREKGHLAEREGATWFASTALGEDKDNVVVRSDGTATYFATDIAYHYNKFIERGLDRVIDIWGADHQGHVSRMGAVLGALDIDPTRLNVIISQLVTLRRGGESVRVSKRSGDMITLSEVIDEVGADACRFFFLARSADSQMDFDLELARKESSENPVYYVQYAHARIASILRLAEEENITWQGVECGGYTEESEMALIRRMLELPEIIELAARCLAPHHLPHYAQELATAFHSFYKQCRVISKDNPERNASRLQLAAAAQLVLSRTLRLMGMSAPEKM